MRPSRQSAHDGQTVLHLIGWLAADGVSARVAVACSLITALLCLLDQVITQDRTGHKDPVRGALYNSAFAVIVSVDEGGTTCVWNLQVKTPARLACCAGVATCGELSACGARFNVEQITVKLCGDLSVVFGQ